MSQTNNNNKGEQVWSLSREMDLETIREKIKNMSEEEIKSEIRDPEKKEKIRIVHEEHYF